MYFRVQSAVVDLCLRAAPVWREQSADSSLVRISVHKSTDMLQFPRWPQHNPSDAICRLNTKRTKKSSRIESLTMLERLLQQFQKINMRPTDTLTFLNTA